MRRRRGDSGAARLYRLPQAKASRVGVTFVTLVLVAALATVVGPRLGLLPTAIAAALGLVAALAAFDRHAVIVGSDGVLHRDGVAQHFARYASITRVDHLAPGSERNGEAHWIVQLRLKNGAAVRIGTGMGERDALGEAIVKRLRERRRRALTDGEHAYVEGLLLRGERGVEEWLASLERLRESANQAYRSAVGPEELWLVLRDDGARLTARVGAAMVLRSPQAMRRLRRVAEGVADPITRGVLRTLARAPEAGRVEALEALHDRGVRVPVADVGRWSRVR